MRNYRYERLHLLRVRLFYRYTGTFSMELSLKSRHQRKVCEHCNELLSYSAYRSHKALYFNETEQRWIGSSKRTANTLTCATEDLDDPTMDYDDAQDDHDPIQSDKGKTKPSASGACHKQHFQFKYIDFFR